MLINANSLTELYSGFNVSFNKGLKTAPSHWNSVAMKVMSSSADENYSWLAAFPGIREWLGDRHIHTLSSASYKLVNKNFEMTIEVKRNNIEDDQYGFYGPLFEKMGYETALHPDELVFSVLTSGRAAVCYDGQYFFDIDHPGKNAAGADVAVSNYSAGESDTWYLLDCSQPIKPLIYQERLPFDLQSITAPNDEYVFMKDKYLYGVRGRSNAGFGLWQLAHCSKKPLNAENFALARTAMMTLRRDNGKPLGVSPTHLVVPPQLDTAAREVLRATNPNGGTNIWANSVELICTPFL